MKITSYLTCLLIVCLALTGCQTDYSNIPTYSAARQLQAVIETPAGSSYKKLYNRNSKAFENAKQAGQDLVIRFLPYPANYGFIPSTEVGANGRGLSTLVLADRAEPGTVMEVIPVATLMLEKHDGSLYPVIVTVPARPSEQVIQATDYASFSANYPAAKAILQQWFVHHKHTNSLKFIGWKDELFAEKEIQRWMKL